MKKCFIIVISIFLCLIMSGCNDPKVNLIYNCYSIKNDSCNLINGKLDCNIEEVKCGDKTFIGWYDSPRNGNKVDLNNKFSDNTTLYAYWKGQEYTITYDLNGGQGNIVESLTTSYNESLPSINLEIPIKKGYEFMGYFDNPDYTKGSIYYDKKCNSTKVLDKKSDITLYAGWKKKTYIVTYDLNGGSKGQLSEQKVLYNELLPKIKRTIPIRKGYEFMGYYDNPNYEVGTIYYDKNCEIIGNNVIDKNIVLYAGWKEEKKIVVDRPESVKTYTVSFNLNGGSGQKINNITATYGKIMPKINSIIPTKRGYEFMGFFDNKDYTKGIKYYDNNFEPLVKYTNEKNITLYAGWKYKTYSITYYLNGGSNGQSGTLNVIKNNSLPEISKTIPIRQGYEFMGYFDNKDYTKGIKYYNEKCEGIIKYNNDNSINLYAGWKAKTYTISFNSNGGEGGQTKSLNVVYDSSLPTISKTIPTRKGYEFMGYFDNKDYINGTKYYDSSSKSSSKYNNDKNITLYAGWKVKTILIKYDCNGGSGSQFNQTVTYGQTVTLNKNVCKNGSLKFNGWMDTTKKIWKDKWSGTWTYLNGQNGIVNDTLTLKATWGSELRVATYNIGYFGCGTSKKVKCKSTVSQITNMFKENKVDIVGIQEGVPASDVIQVGKNAGMNYYYKTQPSNVNVILSKYPLNNKKTQTLVSCYEKRSLDKATIVINGVTISVYNTHYSYQSGCPSKHMKYVADIIKKDPNPIILTGDTNTSKITNYNTYLKPLGFEIAAYDGKAHGYCDSVFINSKGHIDVLSSKTVEVYGKYSDHNFVVATLLIH